MEDCSLKNYKVIAEGLDIRAHTILTLANISEDKALNELREISQNPNYSRCRLTLIRFEEEVIQITEPIVIPKRSK